MRPKQELQFNFPVENCILIEILLKVVPDDPTNNEPASVQKMAWCRICDKPLPAPMMIYTCSILKHIFVTRPRSVPDTNQVIIVPADDPAPDNDKPAVTTMMAVKLHTFSWQLLMAIGISTEISLKSDDFYFSQWRRRSRHRSRYTTTSQRRHMSVMASQITGNSNVWSTVFC